MDQQYWIKSSQAPSKYVSDAIPPRPLHKRRYIGLRSLHILCCLEDEAAAIFPHHTHARHGDLLVPVDGTFGWGAGPGTYHNKKNTGEDACVLVRREVVVLFFCGSQTKRQSLRARGIGRSAVPLIGLFMPWLRSIGGPYIWLAFKRAT
ncbi:hypothetical protein MCOR25_004573 [Pyricularia grisea]|nr:hypothetical protein MCOR25_004573 [Pyricularia grisea]